MRVNSCAAMLVLALLPAAQSGAAAQTGSAVAERFRAMDQDRDGVITRSEWRGSTQSFDVHDWNRDGVLSGDEVRRGTRRQQGWPDDPGDNATHDWQLNDWTPERFDDLDHNRDGRITRDEWHFEAELFRRVDSDRNGSISRSEFLGLGVDDDRDNQLNNLDLNGDRRIAAAEWHGDPRVFARHDRDGDGFLNRVELLGADEDDAPADLFGSLDVNRDNRVTHNEWHWARAASIDETVTVMAACRATSSRRPPSPHPPHSGARHTKPDTTAGCWTAARRAAKTGSGTSGISTGSASSNRPTRGTPPRWGSGPNIRPATGRRSRAPMARVRAAA